MFPDLAFGRGRRKETGVPVVEVVVMVMVMVMVFRYAQVMCGWWWVQMSWAPRFEQSPVCSDEHEQEKKL